MSKTTIKCRQCGKHLEVEFSKVFCDVCEDCLKWEKPMNIEEIKKRVNEDNAIYLYCKDGDAEEGEVSDDVSYLLSVIEQAERALKRLQSKAYLVGNTVMMHEINVEIEALQAIRK